METTTEDARMLSGGAVREFARFVLPSVFGMLAISSASVIDGIFVGNFVGPTALASVNIVMPLLALVFGVVIMITLGGSVAAGKYLGENKVNEASNMFSKTGITACSMLGIFTIVTLMIPQEIVKLLGARNETVALSAEYAWVIAWFFPAFGVAVLLSQFARVDGSPNVSLIGMLGIAVANLILDYVFIARLDWGLQGAALATGLSFVVGGLILLVYFLGPKAKLRLIRPYGSWREMPTAAFNGFSEFLNETSSGLILLLFNWILMIQVGANGVAAFAVVDYLMYFGILIFYGVGEGVVPLISVNFGGRQPERIRRFLLLAVGLNFLIGLTIVVSLLVWPVQLIGIFFTGSEPKILSLSLIVISIIWPMFIFNGANIAVSAYFTGMHRGTQSAIIAVMRSLIFPVGFILLFWQMFGFIGAFYALPVSEALAFGLSIFLLRTRLPNQLTSMN